MQTNTITSLEIPARAERSIWHALLATDSSWTPTAARLALGVVMLPHGLQKTLGWFGGYGFTGTMHWFTDSMHVPWILGFAAILAESLGALALLAGFLSRAAAFTIGAVFLTAVALVHAPNGFFMNWSGAQAGEGFEYFILGLTLVAIVLVRGGGAASVDGRLARASK